MRLTRLEKERIADSRLKLQSVSDSLKHVDPAKVRDFAELQDCIEAAEDNLRGALHSDGEGQSKS
jgi:hypothetical protein